MPTHCPTLDSLIAYSTTHGGPLHRESHETRRAGGDGIRVLAASHGVLHARDQVVSRRRRLVSRRLYRTAWFGFAFSCIIPTGRGTGEARRASAACVCV